MSPDPSRPITTVVCDLGGVLTTPLSDAFLAYQEHSGVALTDLFVAMAAVGAAHGANPLEELECGLITETTFVTDLSAALSSQTGAPVDLSDFGAVWFSHLHNNTAMFDKLSELKADGLRLALLTNNVKEWEGHWRPRMPIDALFEVVVDSGFVGMRKPDPAIYALTRERLGGVPAAEILFIDDLEVNLDAARAAGWRTVHFQSTEQAIAEIDAALAPG